MPKLRAKHRTEIRYGGQAGESINELHLSPMVDAHQEVEWSRIVVDPGAETHTHLDCYGNVVHWFHVAEPHGALVVESEAVVYTRVRAPVSEDGPRLEDLRDPAYIDTWAEYLAPSEMVRWGRPVMALLARMSLPSGGAVAEWAGAAEAEVNRLISYVPGATVVDTPLEQVVRDRRGVCQDMAHLMIAICRARGVAARYVSGWLHVHDSATPAESHAWVEVALPGSGWREYDPTHPGPALESYVRLAVGRDYADVPPLRGSYLGPPTEAMRVTVTMDEVA